MDVDLYGDTAVGISILIAEDHTLVREGTRQILERAGFSVVAEASDGLAAAELAHRVKPDIAILDLRLPKMNGIEASREIRKLSKDTKILILSAYDDDDYVVAAMEAGASGYLLKTAPGDTLVEAVRAVHSGELVLDQAIGYKIRRILSYASKPPHEGHGQLTERERQVLKLAAKGMRNKEIARNLNISVRTVEDYMGHIFEKLGATSRTEAVMRAVSRGFLSLPEEEDGNSQP